MTTPDELEEALRRCAGLLDRLDGPDADRDEQRDAKALRAVMGAAETLQAVWQTIGGGTGVKARSPACSKWEAQA